MPRIMNQGDGNTLIARRHPEYDQQSVIWRWLLDSLEGGERYRRAKYPSKQAGGGQVGNLLRHNRETPPSRTDDQLAKMSAEAKGFDKAASSTFDLRLERTPVPTFVSEIVEKFLSPIYAQEIRRDYGPASSAPPTRSSNQTANPSPPRRAVPPGTPATPTSAATTTPGLSFPVQVQPPPAPEPVGQLDPIAAALADLWSDVDGTGLSMDLWMEEVVGPLLVLFGQLDIYCLSRPIPPGTRIESKADEILHRLDQPILGYFLPDNMLWWRTDSTGHYLECLTVEYVDGPLNKVVANYRHWDADSSVIYNEYGKAITEEIPHAGGAVPIIRVFDRKKYSARNVGHSRMEEIAEKQRDYYNRDSELIISDVMQATPHLSGPTELMGGGSITVGPGWTLPKFITEHGIAGWEYVSPPKGGDDSIRKNLDRRRDEIDRAACLTKPAGSASAGSGTVSQSGISKELDQEQGNRLLSKISRALGRAEQKSCTLYLRCRFGTQPTPDILSQIRITYPVKFNLFSPAELLNLIAQFQRVLAGAGTLPLADGEMLEIALRHVLAGFDEEALAPLVDEIQGLMHSYSTQKDEAQEGDDQDSQTPGTIPVRSISA